MTSQLLGYSRTQLQAARGLATAAETTQQPALWREVRAAAELGRSTTGAFLDPLLNRPDLRIVLTGAGTSAFAGEILAPTLTAAMRRRVEAVPTTDLVSNPGQYFAEDLPTLMVSFARSGDSPESTAATRLADQCLTECHHLVLTCNPDGALALQHAQSARSLVLTMPHAANDTGFAMTSSFTCMTLSALLALAPDLVAGDAVERLADAAEQLMLDGAVLAKTLVGRRYDRVVYLGSGPLKGLARESALKMLELTAGQVATWFDSPLGFRHGPKSVIDERTLIVVYVSGDPHTSRYDWDIVNELRALMRQGSVVAVTGSGALDGSEGPAGAGGRRATHGLEDLDDAARAIVFVVVAQILALHHSLSLGLAPDNPFPSGTVNRVVEGVTIHPLAPRD